MGLVMKNAMNRTTKTTGNGYINDGGRGGGGGGASLSTSGDSNTTQEGVEVGTLHDALPI